MLANSWLNLDNFILISGLHTPLAVFNTSPTMDCSRGGEGTSHEPSHFDVIDDSGNTVQTRASEERWMRSHGASKAVIAKNSQIAYSTTLNRVVRVHNERCIS